MRVIKEIASEDCFDGNFIKEYKLNTNIDFNFVNFLKNFGEIIILNNLKHPFYSFDKKYFFTIKGIINQNEFKVIYRRNNMEKTSKFLEVILKNYKKKDGIANIKKCETIIVKTISCE